MKKTVFLLSFILLAAISNAQKVAVVDTQKLIDTIPQKKLVVAEIDHMTKVAEQEIADKRTAMEKMVIDYQANEKGWSDQIRAYEQQRIQKKQQEIQDYIGEADERITSYSRDRQQDLYLIAKAAVQTVAEKKGFDVVLEVNNTVFSKAPDLTNEVAAILAKQ